MANVILLKVTLEHRDGQKPEIQGNLEDYMKMKLRHGFLVELPIETLKGAVEAFRKSPEIMSMRISTWTSDSGPVDLEIHYKPEDIVNGENEGLYIYLLDYYKFHAAKIEIILGGDNPTFETLMEM